MREWRRTGAHAPCTLGALREMYVLGHAWVGCERLAASGPCVCAAVRRTMATCRRLRDPGVGHHLMHVCASVRALVQV